MDQRYLKRHVVSDLATKMVFVAGPRQVGKTTMAKRLLGRSTRGYLNWDVTEHRQAILLGELPSTSFWVLDELHKYRLWRGFLKGLFDNRRVGQRILVTGSARLDYYRHGGDSLQGRYHAYRMHPLSVAELKLKSAADFKELLTLGGFPEPYLSGSLTGARRWSRAYRTLIVREELASLERIHDLDRIETLALRLPELVGSPLSINALREDLQVSHATASKWLDALERLYALFRLAPFGAPKIRAVKKERKHYHFDWNVVPGDPARFENLVACHLLKWVHFIEDTEGRDLELRYFRDVDGREVDFVVTEQRKPILLVECKWSDAEVDRGLRYLRERFPSAAAWQISATGTKDYVTPTGIRVAPALSLLRNLT